MPVNAYVLIQTEVGKAASVTRAVAALAGVVAAEGVTGPYDVIVRAEAGTVDELGQMVVGRIQLIEGITRTVTCPWSTSDGRRRPAGLAAGSPVSTCGQRMAPDVRSSAISPAQPPLGQRLVACWPGIGRRPPDGARGAGKRGAGAGWTTPATSVKVRRDRLCGWSGASAGERTGAAQASLPSKIASHSARVLAAKTAANRSFISGQASRSIWSGSSSALQADQPDQLGVELGLDGADADEPAVRCLVDLVEVGAGVQQVGAALVRPDPRGAQGEGHGHQRGGAVDHGRVDDLAVPVRWALMMAANMPKASNMPPPPKSPTRLRGGSGRSPARPIGSRAPARAM